MAHLETVQINDTLAQLRPSNVLDNGITRGDGVDTVNTTDGSQANPKAPDKLKSKAKAKETVPSVPYFKLFRLAISVGHQCCCFQLLTQSGTNT